MKKGHFLLGLALMAGMTLPAFGLTLEGERIRVDVDEANCRWSARLKGSPLSLKDVYFLPGDNPAGWTVKAASNENDYNPLGRFETVTLHGTKPGELDFDYQISVNKFTSDIIVSLGRANHTGKTVHVGDMDYMVVPDARLGGTSDQWMTFGTSSSYKARYKLTSVNDITTNLIYETEQLARNRRTGAVILMGHLTVWKGHSRFSFAKGDSPESMKMRAYCNYEVTMPAGRSFVGEKLLVSMGDNGQRVLEHLGDLIAVANDVRLKERCPIDLDDRGLIAGTHSRFMNWMSGSKGDDPDKFFEKYGLDKFYYANKDPESGARTSWSHYYSGGEGIYFKGTKYPDACYLPILITWPFGTPRENNGGRVIDFSNPLAVQCERERVFKTFAGEPDKVHWAHLDYADLWDKWPGQHDPFMSQAETWRAGAMPWREIHEVCPRVRNRACMQKVDFSYGFVDIARTSDDADQSFGAFLARAAIGTAMRFFYNGRVYWNDCDNFHVYRYKNGEFSYGQGKVASNYRGFAGSTTLPSEKFDVEYPPERLELLKRISPVTMDVSYPVDLFERIPVSTWNMPIRRPFGQWNIVAVFNYGPLKGDVYTGAQADPFTITLEAAKDLRLDPNKEYVVYEFWSKKLLGAFKGQFTSRPVKSIDCDIYSIVEKQDHPILVSTSRHIRQMAVDIKKLAWSGEKKSLSGLSRAVSGDPYQLRIYAPEGFSLDRVELTDGLKAATATDGQLLTVDFTTTGDTDVAWSVYFK